ncbi:MAG: AzlD domain-containing protein [Leptolyngbyaceae cyanobacterium SM1_1_3]|nr:AzlD domain-containing protein [Leptolyngbyaceae cyanobacterium SM1_1_3]NJN04060.1 AzlD domain-containing protein [Leptolyngbyaceae cyanobacterium RM1_1_2]NJO09726.1 AzlD domain-containing protein [Leptolyngbyaceae cyanobacterium SL_1_1]
MNPNELILIAGMTLVTFSIRYFLLAMSGKLSLSPRLLQTLNYVPPAVLTAIVVPAVLIAEDQLWLGLGNPRLIGAIAALGVGLWRKNLLLTIMVGMGAFLLWQAVDLAN